MWTTSSFRADALVVGMALTTACTTAAVAPEAPRAPLRAAAAGEGKPAGPPSPLEEPLEVRAASIRPAAAEPGLLQRFGRLADRPEDLLVVDVQVQRPLGDVARSALPVILLNERPLLSTIVVDPTRLRAVVRVTEVKRGEDVVVAVTWLGDSTVRSRNRFVVRVP